MSLTKQNGNQLSYSSARLLQGCERKFYHYKVKETPIDSDASKDTTAFIIGKAFHHILEMSNHKKPEKIGELLEECVQNLGLAETDCGLVHAMVLKYLRLRATTNLEAVAVEWKINDPTTIGFVDLIEKDTETGEWFISDLKTAKTFYPTTLSKLPNDRQLNLYASYAPQIAEEFGLDLDKFAGCRYKVTTKSSAKQQAKESYLQYVKRVTDKFIKSYDIIIPKDKLNIVEVVAEHKRLYNRAQSIRDGAEPLQNFGYCESYFKPCEYWSQCHGDNFSNIKDSLEVLEIGKE